MDFSRLSWRPWVESRENDVKAFFQASLLQVDATEESNKALASKYEVQGFPTLKVRS